MSLLLLVLFAAPSFAQDYFIADELYTYMHSGPSNQYRIIGSVDAGEKIKILDANKETGYTEVIDSKGRQGWVESKFVTRKVSMAVRLPKLEQELAEVKSQLANAQNSADDEKQTLVQSLDSRNAQIRDLEQSYSDINKKLISAQTEIRELRAKLDTQKEDLLMRYFLYGGGVAMGGIFLGLILPHLIPRRKKSRNDWV
jgi:SH3 domain protein